MKRRRLWLIIAVAVVVLVGAMAVWRLSIQPYDYHPTGDELFDRYAVLVLKEMAKDNLLVRLRQRVLNEDRNPQCFQAISTELISWEEEYKDDPRYWQLRALNNIDALPSLSPTDPDAEERLLDFILNGYFTEECFGVVDYLDLSQSKPDKAIELAKHATKVAPDNAFHLYMFAQILADQGRMEQAVEELKKGNTAARNDLPQAYPVSIIPEHPEYLDQEAMKAVAGYMLNMQLDWFITNECVLSSFLVTDLLQTLDLKTRPEVADELLKYSLRFIRRERFATVRALAAHSMIDEVLNHMQAHGPVISPAQQREFGQIMQAIDNSKQKLTHYVKSKQLPSDWTSDRQASVEMWEEEKPDRAVADECLEILSILNPPPFAAWARGELVFADE